MRASRVLMLLLVVSVLSFSVRLTEMVTGLSHISSTAFAESQDKGDADTSGEDHADPQIPKAQGHMQQDQSHEEDAPVDVVTGQDAKAPKWRDASDSNVDVTKIKLEMFEDLSRRREQLEKAEKELQVREALLKAAEQELDRKVQELTRLREEIEKLLQEKTGQEKKRIDSLVKIYEGMKPKDAARIFDTLDVDVLVSVMSKMSERKVAPILAAMNPERARTVTIMLAEEKSLPVIP